MGRFFLAGIALTLSIAASIHAQPVTQEEPKQAEMARTVAGILRSKATIHCIGIEWDVQGDTNHDATCKVQYRAQGAADWKEAMPLYRVDYAWYYGKDGAKEPRNMFAGSILFLKPATAYDIKLELVDPDGGNAAKELRVATRPIPEFPQGGRTFHVVPGEGGGAGTAQDPFRGVGAAEAAAQAGDTLRLHAGAYGEVQLNKGGAEGGKYIVWTAAGDGEAVFEGIKFNGSYIWLDNLTLNRAQRKNGITTAGQPVVGAVITRNKITGFHYSIILNRQCQDWHIADNVIVGSKSWPNARKPDLAPGDDENNSISGEGVELAESIGGHVVCYNTISQAADGVSYPGQDTDIYGNDIFRVTDDALEPDRGGPNVRMWGNRTYDVGNAAISFQPMRCGPWYIIRNQIINTMRQDTELRKPHIFKFRVQDRFALINNTIVFPAGLDSSSDSLFTSTCRNNLFVSSTGTKPIWVAYRHALKPGTTDPRHVMPLQRPDWRTDVDYNGYDWGEDVKDWRTPAFRYNWTAVLQNCYFTDLAAFSKSTGVDKNSIRVRKEETFQTWTVPATVGDVGPTMLELKEGATSIGAGSALPNVCEVFTGQAPDLGAHEFGQPLPHYGARDEQTMKDHALYWVLSK